MAACPRPGGRDAHRGKLRQAAPGHREPNPRCLPSGPEAGPRPCVQQGMRGGCGPLLRHRPASLGQYRSVKFLFFSFSATMDFVIGVDRISTATFARTGQQIQKTHMTYVKYKKVHGRFGVHYAFNPLETHNYSL